MIKIFTNSTNTPIFYFSTTNKNKFDIPSILEDLRYETLSMRVQSSESRFLFVFFFLINNITFRVLLILFNIPTHFNINIGIVIVPTNFQNLRLVVSKLYSRPVSTDTYASTLSIDQILLCFGNARVFRDS